jgi:hypothetical protein
MDKKWHFVRVVMETVSDELIASCTYGSVSRFPQICLTAISLVDVPTIAKRDEVAMANTANVLL